MLRLLLLEARQQLHLLCSDFAAARQDACDSVLLLQRFPSLLAPLQASVHLQAGLYAQALGAIDAALAHFRKVAASSDSNLGACATCLAALCYIAQGTSESGAHADARTACAHARSSMHARLVFLAPQHRRFRLPVACASLAPLSPCPAGQQAQALLAPLAAMPESDLGYAARAVSHIAGGLLQLAAAAPSADERADAKQRLSKALKLAHGRLQNHQLVSQILLFMAPLQVSAVRLRACCVVCERACTQAVCAAWACTGCVARC